MNYGSKKTHYPFGMSGKDPEVVPQSVVDVGPKPRFPLCESTLSRITPDMPLFGQEKGEQDTLGAPRPVQYDPTGQIVTSEPMQ